MTNELPTKARWARQLRAARTDHGDTQTELAEDVGIPQSTISLAERGVGSITVFERLARHYGVTLEAGTRTGTG